MNKPIHLVMFSGGAGSWAAGRRVVERHGPEDTRLLFADTLMEDEDLYRFLEEAAADIGAELIHLTEGRTPWEVFFDERFLGNSRVDPCSKILKRKFLRRWLEANYPDPDEVVIYLGIDWTEEHRYDRARPYWEPYKIEAPLCDEPLLDKAQVLDLMRSRGIKPPRLYDLGFPHNNCGGFCIKAGQAQFKRLLETMPERYAYHEGKEQEIRSYLNKDVAILIDRRGGGRKPLTLKDFRLRLVDEGEFDPLDWGGCGCFSPDDGDDAAPLPEPEEEEEMPVPTWDKPEPPWKDEDRW